jgi:hypothetical protein
MKRDDLFGLTPKEFTPARNALAKTDPSVKSLKKPAWPLWAVNQLGRRYEDEVRSVLDAGTRLARAHRDVLKGQASAEDLRAATSAHHEALAKLERLAGDLLREEKAGAGPSVIRRVRATLHAASIGDDETRRALSSGVLEDELDAPDVLAGMTDLGPLPKPKRRPRPKRDVEAAKRQAAEDKARARVEAQAQKLVARAEKLEKEARELRRKAKELQR